MLLASNVDTIPELIVPSVQSGQRTTQRGALCDATPSVTVSTDFAAMADECAPVLGRVGIYQRNGKLVEIADVTENEGKQRHLKNYAGTPVIKPVQRDRLREVLSHHINWRKWKSGQLDPTTPPESVVGALLARPNHGDTPRLISVKSSPFLRSDGTVCAECGYDNRSGYYHAPDARSVNIPESPSHQDAQRALNELVGVFVDFPCETIDRLVVVAAVFTILARPAIDGPVPCFVFDANKPRTGKGFMAHAVALIATGREWTSSAWSNHDEIKKVLDGWALDGIELAGFDDIPSECEFRSPALNSYLTTTTPNVRRLGESGGKTCTWDAVLLATGNNIRITRDMRARVVVARLLTKEVRPESRTGFVHSPLLPWLRKNRQELLTAALLVLRAWVIAGKPRTLTNAALGAFDSWVDLVVQCIGWVAGVNILDRVPSLGEVDEEDTWLTRLVERLRSLGPRGAAQLAEDSETVSLVRERVPDKTIDASRVGYVLRGVKHQAVELVDGKFWITDVSPSESAARSRGVRWSVAKLCGHDGG